MKRVLSWLSVLAIVVCIFSCAAMDVRADELPYEELTELFQLYASDDRNEMGIEGITYDIGVYFFHDPTDFIRTLAQESQQVQNYVMEDFPRSMFYEIYPGSTEAFPDAVFSIELTGSDSAAARRILRSFVASVEEYWGIADPNPPKTGDPVAVVVAVMAACGLGTVALIRRRKDLLP